MDHTQHRIVQRSSETSGSVTTFNGTRHTIDLAESSCTCGRFQLNKIPCGHTVALIHKLRKDPRGYISDVFRLTTFRDIYRANLHPIDVTDLPEGDTCRVPQVHVRDYLPPRLRKPQGRPRECRQRKGQRHGRERAAQATETAEVPNGAPQRCTQCDNVGHNRRTCKEVIRFRWWGYAADRWASSSGL
jgi:hypothetical protein